MNFPGKDAYDPIICDAQRWLQTNVPDQAARLIREHNGMPPEHWRKLILRLQCAQEDNLQRMQRMFARHQNRGVLVTQGAAAELPGAAVHSPESGPRSVPENVDPDGPTILLDDPKSSTLSPTDDLDPTSDDISTRTERYARLRKQSIAQAAYIFDIDESSEEAEGFPTGEIAEATARCGSYLVFHRYDCIGENRLHAGMFCQRGRLCAFCSMRRMVRKVAGVVPKVWQVITDTGAMPHLETLTVKNGPDLNERLAHLRDCEKQLNEQARKYRHQQKTGKGRRRRYTERAKSIGQIWSVEVKRGSGSGIWHPHMHSLLLCEDEIDECALRQEWFELTGDSFRVDVRPFHCVEKIQQGATLEDCRHDLVRDLMEVLSYTLKFSTMDAADTWDAFKVCHGKQLSRCRGDLFGCNVRDEYLDAPLEVSDLPFVEVIAKWIGDRYAIDSADEWPVMGGVA